MTGTERPVATREQSEEWPQIHFDTSQSGFARDNTGPKGKATVEWEQSIPGEHVHHGPVVADGRVFIVNLSDNSTLFAFSESDGTEQWTYNPQGEINTAPSVANDTVYVGLIDPGVAAVSASDGSVVWERTFSDFRPGVRRVLASGGTVYVTLNRHIVALDAATGDIQWSKWWAGAIDGIAVADGTLYFDSRKEDWDGGNRLVAASAADGSLEWKAAPDVGGWKIAIHDGSVYARSTKSAGTVIAIDADSGEERWRTTLDGGGFRRPAVTDDRVFLTADYTGIYALSTYNGSIEWEYHEGTEYTAHTTPPVVAGDVVYYLTAQGAHGFRTDDGTELWRANTQGGTHGNPAVANGRIYKHSYREPVQAIGGEGLLSVQGEVTTPLEIDPESQTVEAVVAFASEQFGVPTPFYAGSTTPDADGSYQLIVSPEAVELPSGTPEVSRQRIRDLLEEGRELYVTVVARAETDNSLRFGTTTWLDAATVDGAVLSNEDATVDLELRNQVLFSAADDDTGVVTAWRQFDPDNATVEDPLNQRLAVEVRDRYPQIVFEEGEYHQTGRKGLGSLSLQVPETIEVDYPDSEDGGFEVQAPGPDAGYDDIGPSTYAHLAAILHVFDRKDSYYPGYPIITEAFSDYQKPEEGSSIGATWFLSLIGLKVKEASYLGALGSGISTLAETSTDDGSTPSVERTYGGDSTTINQNVHDELSAGWGTAIPTAVHAVDYSVTDNAGWDGDDFAVRGLWQTLTDDSPVTSRIDKQLPFDPVPQGGGED